MDQLWKTLQENLVFVLVSAAIVAGLYLVARLSERYLLPSKRKITTARRVSIIGICAAIATVLHILDFPLLFLAPEFYKLDFSEIPVLMCGFYLGPSATVACEGVKILLKLLLKGTTTAFVGDFANFAVGCSLVLPAAIIYHIRKTKKTAIIGLVVGTVILAVFGSAFNAVYLLPKFSQLFGLPLDSIIAMGSKINGNVNSITTFVALCVAPLNLLKGAVVSVLTLLLYKRIAKVFSFHEK
ncbi:MAG: ECF transporter S component [Oscillospiraceae bacterium]|nr:ECF transporter S component [Oscillospiraceae bacterium]